jgi:hypothetical protein
MNGTCPHCGFRASIEAYLQGDDAKAAVVAAAALPVDLHRLVWSYLGLYRKPDAKQVMTWSRAERLIKELSALVNDPQIQWDNGRVVPNGAVYWVQAVQRVLDMPNLRRPLENPNLVRKIAYELRGLGGELAESEAHRRILTTQNRELLARVDLLTRELAEARELAFRLWSEEDAWGENQEPRELEAV